MPFLCPFNHQSLSAAALGAASESDLIPCADVLAHEPLTNDPDEEDALPSTDTESLICKTYVVTEQLAGQRIDKVAAEVFADYSREQIKHWLESGELSVNGCVQKPKYRLKVADTLQLHAKRVSQQPDVAENIALDIVYEDDAVLVVNKPVGLVVHPGAGNWQGTLVNALLYHYPNSRLLPRAGLVHRIDKDTSGLMVVAKDSQSQLHLINQLKNKSVYRLYQALVIGRAYDLARHTTIDAPIARHATQRTKMAVVQGGKSAVTHLIQVNAITEYFSLVKVRLETGRTHQIRVHLSHLGFPLVGDTVYGSARKNATLIHQLPPAQSEAFKNFPRQALHAYELGFVHPKTGLPVQVTAALPEDMTQLLATLQA